MGVTARSLWSLGTRPLPPPPPTAPSRHGLRRGGLGLVPGRPVGGSPWGRGACPLPTGLLLPAVGLATGGWGASRPPWSPASSPPPPIGLHLAHLPYCPLGCRQRWVNPEERMWRSGSPIWSQVGTSTSPALRAGRIRWKPHCLLPLSPHCPLTVPPLSPATVPHHCPPSLPPRCPARSPHCLTL